MALFVIVGASGSGKTSLSQRVASMNFTWTECISHTTRPMRNGEEDGKTYYFLDEKEFDQRYKDGRFAEYVEYDGNKYGISHAEIKRVMNISAHVFIIAEYNGYTQIKAQYPDAVGIFLHMSKEDCMANMLLRGDSLEKATRRIKTYDNEIANKGEFDYVVKNVRDKSSKTVDILLGIIRQYN